MNKSREALRLLFSDSETKSSIVLISARGWSLSILLTSWRITDTRLAGGPSLRTTNLINAEGF